MMLDGMQCQLKSTTPERYPSEIYDADQLYDFSAARMQLFRLPPELLEISGLSNFHDTHLLAVQDEDGIVYQIDIWRQVKIQSAEISFAGKGDYEGIEYVEPYISVVKSNGNILSI